MSDYLNHDHSGHNHLYLEKKINLSASQRLAQRSLFVGIFTNTFLSIAQILIGAYTHSSGLIADGLHSISDLFCDFVVIIANHFSQRAANQSYQFGYYRYQNAASLVLGSVLVLVGCTILWQGGQKLLHREAVFITDHIALWISLLTLASKEILFRYMLAVGKRLNSGLLITNAWHARSDAASSLVVSIGIVANIMGYPLLDPLAAIVVGAMIVRIGIIFGYNSLQDLMDRGASKEVCQQIKKIVNETPGVMGCHDLKTRKSASLLLVDIHIEVDGDLTVREGHNIVVLARKRLIKSKLGILNVTTHIDPHE